MAALPLWQLVRFADVEIPRIETAGPLHLIGLTMECEDREHDDPEVQITILCMNSGSIEVFDACAAAIGAAARLAGIDARLTGGWFHTYAPHRATMQYRLRSRKGVEG